MARIEAETKEAAARKRKRTIIRGAALAVVIIVILLAYNLFQGGDDDDTIDASATGEVTTTAVSGDTPQTLDPNTTTSTSTTVTTPTTAEPAEIRQPEEGECPSEDGSSGVETQFAAEPPLCIDLDTKYVAEFVTSEGNFDVLLDPALDQKSVNNFVFLARNHAYDGTLFHRIIDQFMVQGGDVELAGGVGGPGYRFTGASPEGGQYRLGSLAMANTGDPSSNGSQFFIVTGPNGQGLPPLYSLMGQVIEGLDVPLAMQGIETAPDNAPTEDVVVESVTVREASAEDISSYEAAIAG